MYWDLGVGWKSAEFELKTQFHWNSARKLEKNLFFWKLVVNFACFTVVSDFFFFCGKTTSGKTNWKVAPDDWGAG